MASMTGDGSATLGKKAFKQGVALVHALLLLSVFVPPIMLCIQMASNSDLHYFVGTALAQLVYFVIAFIVLLPIGHFFFRFSPWLFLMSFWLPAGTFAGIGCYYWIEADAAVQSLRSIECGVFPLKADLQRSYNDAQSLYHECGQFVSVGIEDCPQYGSMYESSPVDFTYLKGLEHRFQCAGICNSAVRLWDTPGQPAPACGLFAAEWVRGAHSAATFVLFYSVIVILASIPIFIMLLDTFFADYYKPLLK